MNSKLTLKLNKYSIECAKRYAKNHRRSLSAMVENYFNILSEKENEGKIEISPNVLELSGIIKFSEDVNIKEMYGQHLEKKYSNIF